MSDIRQTEYAKFLEAACGKVMAYKPRAIAITYMCEDGSIGSGYFECTMVDKLAMAGTIQQDAIMDAIAANPRWLRKILDEDMP